MARPAIWFEVKTRCCERMQRLQTLDRAHCRQWVQERFSVEQMIDGYERLYQSAPIGPQSQKIIAKPGHGS